MAAPDDDLHVREPEEEETNGRHDDDLHVREPEEEEMNGRHDDDLHVREPEEEETNGRHDEDLNAREPEEEMNWRHDEDEGVSDDNEQSIATDPGQPLSANIPLHILETIFAHLSVQDIMNCSLVCARWSAICRREKVSVHELLALVYVSICYHLLHSSCFGRRAT